MDTSPILGAMEKALVAFQSSSMLSIMFTALSAVGLILAYFCSPYWKLRKLPGPPANFLLGHLPFMAKHGPDMITVLAKEYGPIFKIRVGRQPLVIVTEPELCKEVSVKKFKSIPNRGLPSSVTASPFLGKALATSNDQRWSAMRNTVTSLYQPANLSKLIPTMMSCVELASHHVEASKEDEDIHFADMNIKMTTNVIGKAAFGVDFGLLSKGEEVEKDDVASRFMEAHEVSTYSLKMHLNASLSLVLGLVFPILETPAREVLKRLPWTVDYKIDQANRTLAERLDDIVASRAKELDRGSVDFVSAVLRARESEGPKRELFTPDYISSLAYEHLIAGSPSTAFTISSFLYLVSKHPEVEKKLLQEIDRFGPHDVTPTVEEIQYKFPYMDQVIKESQRYYSPSPLTARKVSKPVEIGGYLLPEGTWIWMALDYLAKDPRNFPEPEKFRPERFDPGCEEQKNRHPYAFLPFGIGPRECVGKRFALQEIKLTVIHLYRSFTFVHSPNMESPLEFEYGGILVNFKHGIKLRSIRRSVFYFDHTYGPTNVNLNP